MADLIAQDDMPNLDDARCCVHLPAGECDEPTVPDAPFDVCFKHAAQLYGFVRAKVAEAALRGTPETVHVDPRTAARHDLAERPSVVYYLKLGSVIKIGTTVNLEQRLAQYPPSARLLATEPGSYDLEAQRLAQFASARVSRREWFEPSPDLEAHIDALAATDDEATAPVLPLDPELMDSLVTASEAATLAGVSLSAINKWVTRGHLTVADRTRDTDRPLYRWIDVARAEARTRRNQPRRWAS